ncbi:integrase arm-type DNA-binding domain-containing protein [Thermosynechococcaceae cyanobacterium BACA0444]|uniref:Integrase arm-type DNA-binding domain-containing protein n=1 Tax=Pseudocalidococcus azoricus BACA0444 TaxID=2918990 RepID=A0AAE4FVW4_9CYAN|nr:integrase arm-type DNA-binding domain-containing protein [Pseudocalidococcus azoricus]MDS3862247.1 integrase arm-type DNA-binding domain-containing protein [Pseudocalidococcus azoricus BACA0444]
MATHKLTDLVCRTVKPTDKTQKLADGYGLYLEVTPKGSKLWRFRYRYERKFKLISLGIYPFVSLSEARAALADCKRLLDQGIDPSKERQATQASKFASESGRFEVVAREWFSKFHAQWAESHAKVNMQRLERDVFPWLGDRPIVEITASEVLETLNRIVNRGAIETAHRVRSLISQIFRYGIATNRITHDVTAGLVGALPPSPEKHLAAITHPKRLGQVLRMFDTYPGGLVVRCALQLTPLLFVRPGELRMMEWADIATVFKYERIRICLG